MSEKLDFFKKKLLYRASYRGTKEMDILLGNFVERSINNFTFQQLKALEKFLDFEDDTIFNFYKYNKIEKNIDKNEISNIFKKFKI
ncbi:MAG: succinate dehydrogenase assembly factor 2 [Pseudomonadota bacterium]|nr:succinate dehydrogenase assembly factor 2 [Pseudomonadota bacterium]